MGKTYASDEFVDYVSEFDGTFAKQVSTLRVVAERFPSSVGKLGLPVLVDRLHNAYKFFCSMTHVTPMLLMAAVVPSQLNTRISPIFHNALCLSLLLQHELFFHQRFDSVRFTDLVLGRAKKGRKEITSLSIDYLDAMRCKNNRVKIDLTDGTVLSLYDK